MIGLLKSVNVRSGIKQPTPDSDLLHAQETSNIEGGLDTRSVVSEVCKQNCRQQHIGLDYHEDAGSILGRKKCSKEACGSPPTKRFCDLTDAAPRKRLRIVSDSSCRHQFEPLFSKCNLLNEYRNRSPSSFFGKSSSSGEIPQASLQCPLGTPTRHTSQQHKDSFCDKAFYKASYKCSHCSKENNVVVETHICPVKLQESASSESATLSQLLNNNGKQFDLKARRTRPNVASTVCNTFDAISNRESYGKINFSVKGEPIKPKEEKGCERQKSMYSDSEKDFVNHSFHSQNSNHYHVNKFRSDNLAILKAFVSNEKKGRLNLATKQLYMPSSEKPHGLKFTPRQHFDIISEDLPADETKQFVSEFGGKKNHAKTGIRSVITKENFVKELKNIFSRLPSLKEERLKEKGVYEMILMGKAYCDKFEFESREKQDRENNPLSNWRSARLSNNGSPALEQRTLDTVSNDHSPSCQLTVEPAKAVCAHDVPSVDRGKNSVISDEVIENGCKSINASSVLQSQANKTKSKTIWTPKELTTNVNKGAFRDNKTADCSDITLNSNFKSSRKQRKLAGHSKKSYPMKESNTHEACSICSKCDDHATNTLGTVFSTSKDISSADQTSVTEASIKKHSISAKEAFLTEGISETRKGINIESYRFDDQSGEEKTHGKIESSATTELLSQDETVIADALMSFTKSQPISSQNSSTLLSKQHEIAAFSLLEAKRFYGELLLSFIKERRRYFKNFYEEILQKFKNCKEKEFAKRTENILQERKENMNLKLECEMTLTMQYFRQELWIRIQKCVCGKVGQFSCCSRCKLVFYCSKMCQVVDYMDHRLLCLKDSLGLGVK